MDKTEEKIISPQTNISLKDRLVILPKNPNSIFVFWQWTESRTGAFSSGELKEEIMIKLYYDEDKTLAGEYSFRWDRFKVYLKPPRQGKFYYAVAVVYAGKETAETAMESNVIEIPLETETAGQCGSGSGFFKRETT